MITPYSKITTITLWTDPYISKNMLTAHLDPNTDAASRKPEIIKKTCDFVETLLPKPATIADFGCGPGLYTDIYQQKGYFVTGVDISTNSLEYAKTQNKYVKYYEMNYSEKYLVETVNFIQMIYCDFGAMSPFAQKHTLYNIKKSLKEDGLFFFDVFSEFYFKEKRENYTAEFKEDSFYMQGKQEIKTRNIKYESMRLLLTHIEIFGSKYMEFHNYDKCYSISEMEVLMNDNGFEIIKVYRDTTGKEDLYSSDTLAFLCKVKK